MRGNIRQTPAVNSALIGTALPIATLAPADAYTAGWWHLCSGGYVRADVVRVITLTPFATATVAATPTRLSVAQTIIAQTANAKTPTPTATSQPRVITPAPPQVRVIEGENGVVEFTIVCPSACEFKGKVEELP